MAENNSECTHDCSTCSANCSSRQAKIEHDPLNAASSVKHVIGVVSGKGGVGKSIVTSLLAATMQRRDNKVAILDADVTGPSIPKAFGVKGDVVGTGDALIPLTSKTGIDIMSVALLLPEETSPVVWRGPVIAGVVKQFWGEVLWENEDYMFIDMPPGTGDVPLTVFQSIPLDGIIVVTTPQELVSVIVEKALNMAGLMNIPVIGVVENMSYVKCPDCGKVIEIYGESRTEALCAERGIDFLGRIPFDPSLANLCDKGIIELFENDYVEKAADAIESFVANK
ncbi:MAG: Mrp/NBP35 family ATP-binding protein [Clostridia bacterium]|nr:Mrp/NBP35 family ATP-binding protein [Clostridia bacterium]